ncbi:MAG: hypothetical protein WCE94_11815 [Candidatus Methanoperedens sp.]
MSVSLAIGFSLVSVTVFGMTTAANYALSGSSIGAWLPCFLPAESSVAASAAVSSIAPAQHVRRMSRAFHSAVTDIDGWFALANSLGLSKLDTCSSLLILSVSF